MKFILQYAWALIWRIFLNIEGNLNIKFHILEVWLIYSEDSFYKFYILLFKEYNSVRLLLVI